MRRVSEEDSGEKRYREGKSSLLSVGGTCSIKDKTGGGG